MEVTPEFGPGDATVEVEVLIDVAVGGQPAHLAGVGSDDAEAARNLMLDQALEGPEQHGQSLALVRTTDEQHPQVLGLGLRAARCGFDVDSVRDDRVVTAVPAAAGPGCRLGDRDPGGKTVHHPLRTGQGRQAMRHRLGCVGVECADHRSVAGEARIPTVDRSGRLVDVDDVEVALLDGPARDADRLGEERDVRDRAVGTDPDRATGGNQVVRELDLFSRRPVEQLGKTVGRIERGNDTHVMASIDEFLGQ